ncbi:MAG: acetoacetate decarboxylase family protein [Candidatus Binatia bacterium]|nr:acetoacetate decarboxylase family protein [Candidatus Binatia bacterium]
MGLGFLSVPQAVVPISTGPIEVPILYRQARSVLAVFPVDPAVLEPVLEPVGLQAVPVFSGRPVIVVAFFDYRDTTIGPYHEAAAAAVVVPRGMASPQHPLLDLLLPVRWRRLGLYIFDLPVTTPVANAAGRELWGLPKFVTDIPIAWEGERSEASVCDPVSGEPMVTLVGYAAGGSRLPLRSLFLYSWLGPALVRTEVDLRGMASVLRSPTFHLHLGARLQPMAQCLAILGLDSAMPALVQLAPSFQARLNLGRRVPLPQAVEARAEAQPRAA